LFQINSQIFPQKRLILFKKLLRFFHVLFEEINQNLMTPKFMFVDYEFFVGELISWLLIVFHCAIFWIIRLHNIADVLDVFVYFLFSSNCNITTILLLETEVTKLGVTSITNHCLTSFFFFFDSLITFWTI